MRFLALSIKIIFALYFAKFTAQQVLMNKYYIVGVLFVGFVVVLFTSWKQRFYVFSIFVLLPFAFPGHFSLPFKFWSDLFALVFFVLFCVDLLMRRQDLLSKKANLLLSAIAVISFWSIINYIYTPVSGGYLGASELGGGLRAYLIIVSGICTFFIAFWFFKYEKINTERCFMILLLIVLVLGNLKIAGFSIPMMGISYASSGMIIEGDYVKIGGLRNLSIIGFPLLFSFYFGKKWRVIPFLILINLTAFCILGFPPPVFAGVVFSTCLYYALINRRHLLPVVAIVLMISTIYVLFLSNSDIDKSKFSRILNVEGGLKEQNTIRYYSYLFMFDIFKRHPVFGKGIGYEPISRQSEFFREYPDALQHHEALEIFSVQGSHGSYASILCLYGIGGVYYLAVMLLGGLYHAWRIAVRKTSTDEEVRIAIFVFVYLGIMIIHMYTAGTGYNYRDVWFLPGVIAGLLARDETEKINKGIAA